MSSTPTDTANGNNLAMIAYIEDEAARAETVEDIADILHLIKTMLGEIGPIKTVQGLAHIRAEVTPLSCNVAMNVPKSLVSTFYDLSDRMNQLQSEDPDTFANAANALHWLANNDKVVN